MSIEQEIREEEARAVAADVRDAQIDAATDDAMKYITPVELMNALTEVDIDKCDGSAPAGSAEDYFYDLLIALKDAAEGNGVDDKIGRAVGMLVWKNHREHEVEPFID